MPKRSPTWFSTGVPVAATRKPARSRHAACARKLSAFLMNCAFVEHYRAEIERLEAFDVLLQQAVARDDDPRRSRARPALLGDQAPGKSAPAKTARSGGSPRANCRTPKSARLPARGRPSPGTAGAPGSARSCRGPCRRRGKRRATAPRAWRANGSPLPGKAKLGFEASRHGIAAREGGVEASLVGRRAFVESKAGLCVRQ